MSQKETRMPQKKKLILNPLPEEIDFSKYDETVTRWDRIIGAAIVVLILLFALVYFFLPSAEQGIDSAETPVQAQPQAELPQNKTEDAAPTDLASVPSAPVSELQVLEPSSTEPELPVVDKPQAQAAPVPDSLPIVQDEPASSEPVLANVNIQHQSISRAVLTQDMNNKEPVSQMPAVIALPEAGITKVILFTQMQGLRGQTLFHDWYRKGVRQARVRIPVNTDAQSSFSSKFINMQMLGDWQVKVVDAQAKVYVQASFNVVAP